VIVAYIKEQYKKAFHMDMEFKNTQMEMNIQDIFNEDKSKVWVN